MICPSCQTDVTVTEQNHGALYTCVQCQAVYFINFEGQAEYGDVPDSLPPEMLSGHFNTPDISLPAESAVDVAPAFAVDDSAENPATQEAVPDSFAGSLEPLIDTINVVSVDSPLEGGLPDELHNLADSSESSYEPVAEVPIEATPSESWDLAEAGNPFETADLADTTVAASGFSQVAQELSDFGNTEVQLASMNYDLQISGLDTQETMRLFKEAIEDSKFGWDASELMKTVRNGQVRFQRLSPVKAYILAKRLQFLDIEKKWKQNVLS